MSQAPSLEDIGENRDLSLQLQPNALQNFMQNLNNLHQIPPSLWLPAAATAQIGTDHKGSGKLSVPQFPGIFRNYSGK